MEYADGATLSSLRVKKPNKCFEAAGNWCRGSLLLCDALSYAHQSANLVHRDPAGNLMGNSRSEPKITDWHCPHPARLQLKAGVSALPERDSNYMSPQQLLEDPSTWTTLQVVGATPSRNAFGSKPLAPTAAYVAPQVQEVIAPTTSQRRAKLEIKGPSRKHWEGDVIAVRLAKDLKNGRGQRPILLADSAWRYGSIG